MKSKATGIQYQSSDNNVYDLDIDVKRDISGKITGGIVIGATLEQNMASMLIAEPGDLKANPDLGVGLTSALLGEDLLEYRHMIKSNFRIDGLVVKHLDFYDLRKFKIDAEYE